MAVISDDLSEDEDRYGVEMSEEINPIFIVALLIGIDIQLNE